MEEHWNSYLSYLENQNILNQHVWMRVFVQILDMKVRKWFQEFCISSIDGIDAVEEFFIREWGAKKGYVYYVTYFGALKINTG